MSKRLEVVPLHPPPGSPDFGSALWVAVADSSGLSDAAVRASELVLAEVGADAVGLTTRDEDDSVVRLALQGTAIEEGSAPGAQDPLAQPMPEGGVLAIDDTRGFATWSAWIADVERRGVRSACFVGLAPLHGRAVTLELYGCRPHAFDEDAATRVAEIAGTVGIALRQAARAAALAQEASDRELVGRATGILMERYHLTAERSMSYLVHSSDRAQLDVRDLAGEIVAAQDRAAARIRAASDDRDTTHR